MLRLCQVHFTIVSKIIFKKLNIYILTRKVCKIVEIVIVVKNSCELWETKAKKSLTITIICYELFNEVKYFREQEIGVVIS